jgi:hypothetical protein
MNERIKELAKQSLPEFYLTNCPSALEKFAELIVRECALTAGLMEHEGRPNIGAQILDNFGVEE